MRDVLVAVACMLAELVLASLRPRAPQAEHIRSNLARFREPHVAAFLGRCLACVYATATPHR